MVPMGLSAGFWVQPAACRRPWDFPVVDKPMRLSPSASSQQLRQVKMLTVEEDPSSSDPALCDRWVGGWPRG